MVMGPEILFMVGEYLSYESSVMPVCLYEPLPPIDQNYSMDKLTLAQWEHARLGVGLKILSTNILSRNWGTLTCGKMPLRNVRYKIESRNVLNQIWQNKHK